MKRVQKAAAKQNDRASGMSQPSLAAALEDNRPQAAVQRGFRDALRNSPYVLAQRKQFRSMLGQAPDRQATPSGGGTALPQELKSGVESLSGIAMDAVKVHYNSSSPASLSASAYARGNDIHLAPGQERHLPHEAWHVVQQAQGRVTATSETGSGVPVNTSTELEYEADVMGKKAAGGRAT
jgi:hypothetical protein